MITKWLNGFYAIVFCSFVIYSILSFIYNNFSWYSLIEVEVYC